MERSFNWDFNPESPDLQRYLNMELNDAADEEPAGAAAPVEPINAAQAADPPEPANPAEDRNQQRNRGPQLLAPDDAAEEPEFYMNSGMEGNSLPNDDVWKKFDLCEGLTNRCPVDPFRDSYDDMPWLDHMELPLRNDAREIRNHDCMWAGHCISEKHDTNNHNNLNSVNYFPLTPPTLSRSEEPDIMPITTPDGPAFAERPSMRRNAVVAPTHARSVLLPSRIVSATATATRPVTTTFRVQRSRTLDSGGDSPRPETPQSLTDNEDLNMDLADLKAVEDLVADSFGYNFINDIVQNLGNEASGYDFGASAADRHQQGGNSNASSSAAHSRGASNRGRRNVVRQEPPIARHFVDHSFFSDHSYHLSKNARMDNLGVQTPSDSGGRRSVSAGPSFHPAAENVHIQYESSEEEIDVETVYAEMRKPSSRSSSSGSGLPTNPSLSDRQQIQLSVASAISKNNGRRQNPRAGASTQARNSNAGASAQARNSNAGASAQARNSGANERGANTRVVPGVKRRYSARGEARRGAGAARRSPEEDEDEEQQARGVKKRRYQGNQPGNGEPPRTARPRTRRAGRNNGRNAAGSSDSEVDSVERRSIHNSMERQRRIDLRNSFEELRKLIPKTAANEKAAKVLILCSGADYCKALTREDLVLMRKKQELRRTQEELLAQVSQLRRSLAARR